MKNINCIGQVIIKHQSQTNCLARCTVCFFDYDIYSVRLIYIRSSNFITIYTIPTYYQDITFIILNTGFTILSYKYIMYVSVLHNAFVKFAVSNCHFVSKSLIMAQLGCNILEIHYNSWDISPQGTELVCLNDSIHLGSSHILVVSSAWVLPKW